MGNISFIVPTKNIEDFNIEKVYELLSENFKDLTFDKSLEFLQIGVRDKKDNLVCDLYFNQDCYILDYDRDIKDLEDLEEESKETKFYKPNFYDDQIEGLKKLKEINPDLDNIIQSTYGTGRNYEAKNDIDFFLKDYFYAYILDEGIHPEYMGPDYVRKKKSNFKHIKKFLGL